MTNKPALVSASEQLERLGADYRHASDLAAQAAEEMLAHFVASHRDTRAVVTRLQLARDSLVASYKRQFGSEPTSFFDSGPAFEPDKWASAAESLTALIDSKRVAWTQAARDKQQKEFQQRASTVLRSYSPTLTGFSKAEWIHMVTGGSEKSREIRSAALARAPQLKLPPPPIGPYPKPLDVSSAPTPGPGPLNVLIGIAQAEQLTFKSWASFDGKSRNPNIWEHHALQMPEIALPIVLNLDDIGAFAVDAPDCLHSVVLNLLSALPANQLVLPIFDPEQGGNSAKFLFGLGDAAERIIGDRVKTTERELADLLPSLEEHITFVTQRFLQGEHASLTAYNKAAGEVAEPYRLLILYDFPSGFSRGGHFDSDLLDQLVRIIRNGPRCGLFTILVCPDLTHYQSTSQGADSNRLVIPGQERTTTDNRVAEIVRSLHCFSANTELSAITLSFLGTQLDDGLKIPTVVNAPPPHISGAEVGEAMVHWAFRPAGSPDSAVAASLLDVVKRNVHAASDVQVTPGRVAELASAEARAAASVFGGNFIPAAKPDDADSWWRQSSAEGVIAHFGRIGARGVADLVLNSETDNYGALIGGRPGSGKSVLLHAVIMSIALEYPPKEVELFLIDFKEGVEFAYYGEARLPHARVVAIESERDFGLSVLRIAAEEIAERGKVFRNEGRGAANLIEYRERTGVTLKRMVLIIDEFQQLFDRADKVATEAAEILELILRQGRAFGIHVILASQSLAGMTLDKHVLRLVPTRIALQSTESDSRLILGEENTDAQLLVRPGEGVINRSASGSREANQRFQAAFWDPDQRLEVLWQIRRRADAENLTEITTVFAGHKPVDVTTVDRESVLGTANGANLVLPVGMPLTLDSRPVAATLQRQEGSNLLIIDEVGGPRLAILLAAALHQGAEVEILDFVGDDDTWLAEIDELRSCVDVTVSGRRGSLSALTRISELVKQRHEMSDFHATPLVLALASMGRARDFDPDAYGESQLGELLGQILRDGPEVGVHVLCWFDRPSGISKRLAREQLNEFGQRLVAVLRREDSAYLIDSEAAATLKAGQGVLADLDRGSEQRLRLFGTPPPGWLVIDRSRSDE